MLTWADGLPSWAWLVVVVLLVPLSCIAQGISGVVYDPEGAVVAQARILLMRDYVKQTESKSSETGEFAFVGLQPGTYQVQIKQERLSLFQQTVILGEKSERVYAVLPLARESESVQIHASRASSVPRSEKSVNRTLQLGGKVEPAELMQPLRPAYPTGAGARGVEGAVVVYATIHTDGRVSDPIVLDSPDPDWRGKPCKRLGRHATSP
jgi:hypothetical protein